LGLDTFHMSTTNQTSKYRISCDTRWQPNHHAVDSNLLSLRHHSNVMVVTTPSTTTPIASDECNNCNEGHDYYAGNDNDYDTDDSDDSFDW